MTDGPEPFGFKVEREDRGRYDPDIGEYDLENGPFFSVRLPHQCDSWTITRGSNYYGVPQAEAVSELRRFIAEATEALAKLEAGQEFPGGDP